MVGHKAEKLHNFVSIVFELMLLIGWNKNNITGLKPSCLISADNDAFALQNEDFMLPRVSMQWAMTSRFHFKKSHCKIWSAHVPGDKPPNPQF